MLFPRPLGVEEPAERRLWRRCRAACEGQSKGARALRVPTALGHSELNRHVGKPVGESGEFFRLRPDFSMSFLCLCQPSTARKSTRLAKDFPRHLIFYRFPARRFPTDFWFKMLFDRVDVCEAPPA